MRHGEHLQLVLLKLMHDIVREAMHEQTPRLSHPHAARRRMRHVQLDRTADRNQKAVPGSGNRVVIVLGCRDKLIAPPGGTQLSPVQSTLDFGKDVLWAAA